LDQSLSIAAGFLAFLLPLKDLKKVLVVTATQNQGDIILKEITRNNIAQSYGTKGGSKLPMAANFMGKTIPYI
jgi:hypothetical protein